MVLREEIWFYPHYSEEGVEDVSLFVYQCSKQHIVF